MGHCISFSFSLLWCFFFAICSLGAKILFTLFTAGAYIKLFIIPAQVWIWFGEKITFVAFENDLQSLHCCCLVLESKLYITTVHLCVPNIIWSHTGICTTFNECTRSLLVADGKPTLSYTICTYASWTFSEGHRLRLSYVGNKHTYLVQPNSLTSTLHCIIALAWPLSNNFNTPVPSSSHSNTHNPPTSSVSSVDMIQTPFLLSPVAVPISLSSSGDLGISSIALAFLPDVGVCHHSILCSFALRHPMFLGSIGNTVR